MPKLMMVMLCFLLVGCAHEVRETERYSLDGWSVVYDAPTEEFMQVCGRANASTNGSVTFILGCADEATKTFYCHKWDFKTCGHELHHITEGPYRNWHK